MFDFAILLYHLAARCLYKTHHLGQIINGLIELKITQRRPNYFHWKVNIIDTFLSSSFLVNVPLFEKSSKSHRAIIVEQNRSKELGNKHLTNFKLFEFDLLQTYNLIHSFLFDGIGILIGCLVQKRLPLLILHSI